MGETLQKSELEGKELVVVVNVQGLGIFSSAFDLVSGDTDIAEACIRATVALSVPDCKLKLPVGVVNKYIQLLEKLKALLRSQRRRHF